MGTVMKESIKGTSPMGGGHTNGKMEQLMKEIGSVELKRDTENGWDPQVRAMRGNG